MKRVLIITATLEPPKDAFKLKRVDVESRKEDYINALEFYTEKLEKNILDYIVFVDNSNYDLKFLKDKFNNDRIEYISFYGLDYNPKSSRGYGEFKLLDYAMENSKVVNQNRDNGVYYKITGRYILKNIGKLMHNFEKKDKNELYCNCRDIPSKWADMYFLGWKYDFYLKNVKELYKKFDYIITKENPELTFRKYIDNKKDQNIKKRFSEPAELIGVRGFDNQQYEEEKYKEIIRKIIYKYLPFVWI